MISSSFQKSPPAAWVARASRLFRSGVPPAGLRGDCPRRSVNASRWVDDSAGRRAEQAGRLCYPRFATPHWNRYGFALALPRPIGALAVAVTLCCLALQDQTATAAPPNAAADAIRHKAEAAIIPLIDAHESKVPELIAEITARTGINIFYTPKKENEAHITIHLVNVPASEAIRYITSLASLRFAYQADGVHLSDAVVGKAPASGRAPKPEMPPSVDGRKPRGLALPANPAFKTKEWKLPANFPSTVSKNPKADMAASDLIAAGIVFPSGSSAVYSRDRTQLTVTNTQENLDLIDALVERSGKKETPAGK